MTLIGNLPTVYCLRISEHTTNERRKEEKPLDPPKGGMQQGEKKRGWR